MSFFVFLYFFPQYKTGTCSRINDNPACCASYVNHKKLVCILESSKIVCLVKSFHQEASYGASILGQSAGVEKEASCVYACHPFAGAMLIFSLSYLFSHVMFPNGLKSFLATLSQSSPELLLISNYFPVNYMNLHNCTFNIILH